jgi:hypothetical protein
MARNKLILSHYEADMVLLPKVTNPNEVVEGMRLTVFAPNLPQRAIEPELLVQETLAHRTSIARDQQSIRGYFFQVPLEGGVIRVRYGDSLEGEVPERFMSKKLRRLPQDCQG